MFNPMDFIAADAGSQPAAVAQTPTADPEPTAPDLTVATAPATAPATNAGHAVASPETVVTPTAPPMVAPVEDVDPDPAPALTVADTTPDVVPAAPGVRDEAFYARRRRNYLLAGVGAVAALGWFFTAGPGALNSSPAATAAGQRAGTQDATLGVDQLAAGDQKKAVAYLTKHSSLDGFTIKATGVRVAASGSNVVISRTSAKACYMYGVIDGQPTGVQLDATGAACTDAEIARAQKTLDDQTIAVEKASSQAAQDTFARASDLVVYYASKNFDASGVPSLKGLPAELSADVRVVANHGSYVDVEGQVAGRCKAATIGADGTLGEITSCQ